MSLLSICTNVLDENGWKAQVRGIAQNTDETARQIKALANKELRSLSRRYDWRHLRRVHLLTIEPTVNSYAMPDDFHKMADSNLYNADQYERVRAAIHLNDFQMAGSLLSAERFQITYQLGLPRVTLTPSPSSVRQVLAFYQSLNFAKAADGTMKAEYDRDDDVSCIPEILIEMGLNWRFRNAKGLDFSVALAEYNEAVRTQFAKSSEQGEIPVGADTAFDPWAINVPSNGFGQ